MIELTRLNGHPILINAELIKSVEQSPDTVIALITGDKILVREASAEVMRRFVAYRRSIVQQEAPVPAIDAAPCAASEE